MPNKQNFNYIVFNFILYQKDNTFSEVEIHMFLIFVEFLIPDDSH